MMLWLLAVTLPARSGNPEGPYLIWMNLAVDRGAEAAIHAYTNAQDYVGTCWNEDAILQARKLPRGLTAALVRRAVIDGERAAQGQLKAILKHPRGGAGLDGYDGVVLITPGTAPRVASFSTSGKIKSSGAMDSLGEPDWVKRFCCVLPAISRDP